MPGSTAAPGHPSAFYGALGHISFRLVDSVGTRDMNAIAAQWPACASPADASPTPRSDPPQSPGVVHTT